VRQNPAEAADALRRGDVTEAAEALRRGDVTEAAEALRRGAAADAIRRERLIVVLRRIEPRERMLKLADELAEAGVRIFEVTFDAPQAADDLVAVREQLAGRGDTMVGAGTVTSPEQLRDAQDAGAAFAVSPVMDHELVEAAVAGGLPFIPGAMTPTEISAAWAAGATFVKLFPASAVGPAFVRELHGPMPDVQLIPTGGVTLENAPAFLQAGAVAVGMGGAIVRADLEARRAIVAAVRA
jgi:2-dehydro-3-deoxyphosphogluconate aldolase/(4S)-4-hydroxy-2-oxoglutarate aldolase